MEFNRIRYFVALAEQLHFTRAADSLFISQSVLSYHISELERELGVELFVRNKHKVMLTSTGDSLLPLARELQERMDGFEAAARSTAHSHKTVRGLRICFDSSFDRFDIFGVPQAIASLEAEYPDAGVSLEHREFDGIIHGVEDLEYDVGFAIFQPGERLSDTFSTLRLGHENFSLISLRSGGISDVLELLAAIPLLLLKNDERWGRHIINSIRALGAKPEVVYMENFGAIFALVQMGRGSTIIPRGQYDAEAKSRPMLRAIDLPGAASFVETCAIWSKGNYNPAIELLLSRVGARAQ